MLYVRYVMLFHTDPILTFLRLVLVLILFAVESGPLVLRDIFLFGTCPLSLFCCEGPLPKCANQPGIVSVFRYKMNNHCKSQVEPCVLGFFSHFRLISTFDNLSCIIFYPPSPAGPHSGGHIHSFMQQMAPAEHTVLHV